MTWRCSDCWPMTAVSTSRSSRCGKPCRESWHLPSRGWRSCNASRRLRSSWPGSMIPRIPIRGSRHRNRPARLRSVTNRNAWLRIGFQVWTTWTSCLNTRWRMTSGARSEAHPPKLAWHAAIRFHGGTACDTARPAGPISTGGHAEHAAPSSSEPGDSVPCADRLNRADFGPPDLQKTGMLDASRPRRYLSAICQTGSLRQHAGQEIRCREFGTHKE